MIYISYFDLLGDFVNNSAVEIPTMVKENQSNNKP